MPQTPDTQSARDQFIDALRSRGMLKNGEEWVIDINLAHYARELAAKLHNEGHTEAARLLYAEAVLRTDSAETAPATSYSGHQP
ncbi:hypothetical protein PV382_23965 [Streptomyces scabiei]|uniref:hypothetical protein n=1 Tax=Streptomyces scabiei TaxID=1930 RepID=UPI0029BD491E|nr:hypothetical protein [Streptomyces scabiei]MDX3175309.1 hypothetical protein [Streptomyces scabiei]